MFTSVLEPFPNKLCQKTYLYNNDNHQILSRKRPDSAVFVLIIPFSIWFWSELYRSHGKKPTESVPTASRVSRMRSNRDPPVTRQWTDADGRHPLENRSTWSYQGVKILNRWLRLYTGLCYYFDPIQQNLSWHSHDCNPTRQNRQKKSRMLRDAPNCREWLDDLSGPFPIRRTLLRTYMTAFRH